MAPLHPANRSKVNCLVTQINDEASPVATLIELDGKRTVGWVYVWETSELSILWIDERDTAAFIDPELSLERLWKAKATTPEDVIAFLDILRKPVTIGAI